MYAVSDTSCSPKLRARNYQGSSLSKMLMTRSPWWCRVFATLGVQCPVALRTLVGKPRLRGQALVPLELRAFPSFALTRAGSSVPTTMGTSRVCRGGQREHWLRLHLLSLPVSPNATGSQVNRNRKDVFSFSEQGCIAHQTRTTHNTEIPSVSASVC